MKSNRCQRCCFDTEGVGEGVEKKRKEKNLLTRDDKCMAEVEMAST